MTADMGFFETVSQILVPLGASLHLAHPDEVEEGLGDAPGVVIVDAIQTVDLEKRLAELRQAIGGPVPTLAVVSPEFEPLLALPGLGGASLDFERTPLHAPSLRARVQRLVRLGHAERDTLTRAGTRRSLLDLVEAEVHQAGADSVLSLIAVGIDRFSEVNLRCGEADGDRVLAAVASRLRGVVQDFDIVAAGQRTLIARTGGDEFGIALPGCSCAVASRVANRILSEVARPIELQNQSIRVTASIGLSSYPQHSTDPRMLLVNAERARTVARQAGGGQQFRFRTSFAALAERRVQLARALDGAIERGEMSLHYQPRLALRSRKVVGAEALVRWNSEELGAVPPAEFIPLAEQSGMIVELGAWVLEEACRQAKRWNAPGQGPMRMSVNVSARQLVEPDVVVKFLMIMRDVDIAPQQIELEVTEGIAVNQPADTSITLKELQSVGIQLALDDFGTGYSSLSTLLDLPFDVVKLDRSVIRDFRKDRDAAAVARSIIQMAHGIGLSVVAEGVTEASQLEWLDANDCDEVQGYHIAKPLPPDEFDRFLNEHRS